MKLLGLFLTVFWGLSFSGCAGGLDRVAADGAERDMLKLLTPAVIEKRSLHCQMYPEGHRSFICKFTVSSSSQNTLQLLTSKFNLRSYSLEMLKRRDGEIQLPDPRQYVLERCYTESTQKIPTLGVKQLRPPEIKGFEYLYMLISADGQGCLVSAYSYG